MTPADIRNHREQLRLSQAAFAQALGVSKRTLIRWERGDKEPTQLEMAGIHSYITALRAAKSLARLDEFMKASK